MSVLAVECPTLEVTMRYLQMETVGVYILQNCNHSLSISNIIVYTWLAVGCLLIGSFSLLDME